MNEDIILEIMSYCPATEMAKFRLLNKECNKRSYELSFMKRHLQRTNSFFCYILHYHWFWNRFCFVSGVHEKEKIQINFAFLPRRRYNTRIEACDTHHGILLCIKGSKLSKQINYIVCKPATKQYRIIPNPDHIGFDTLTTGLMVISSNPFRYKIIRVSFAEANVSNTSRYKNISVSCTGAIVTRDSVYKLSCEVFDSDSDAWERLKNLVTWDLFLEEAKPVSAYGCLHWLTRENNVRRFCMRTETWSVFPVPDDFIDDNYSLVLVSYEGKLGVIHSEWGQGSDIWVLDKSFGTSWVRVKDAKIEALDDDSENAAAPIWFPSNDTVSRASRQGLRLYNLKKKNKCRYLSSEEDNRVFHLHFHRDRLVPFYSNYDRVCFNNKKQRSEVRRRDEEPIENKELNKSGRPIKFPKRT